MLIQSEQTVTTLANVIELTAALVHEVAGHEVADTLNGQVVSKDVLVDVIASRISKNLSDITSRPASA